jgi:type VI secretion system secreted protein Hcp
MLYSWFKMVIKSIQLAAIAAAAVLFGAMAAVSFAGFGKATEIISTDEQRDVLTDFFSLQYASAAQVDYFLKVEGVEGESTHEGHRNEIDVLSWNWGVSNSGSFGSGGGGGAGKATFSDISITKTLDKSSPILFKMCATGQHIEEVKLKGSKILTNKKISEDYYTITLSDVVVSSYQQSGSSGDQIPTESISFNFAKIKVEYKPQNPDGTLGDPVIAEYDLREARA